MKAYYAAVEGDIGRLGAITRLASSLGRRDELPNVELAEEIARTNDEGAVSELVENLFNKDKAVANDCIKVLYEIGARNPRLTMEYASEFGKLLRSNNNRLVWGGMTALDAIALVNAKGVHDLLREITAASEMGSVIARDHAMGILVKLTTSKEYRAEARDLIMHELKKCPPNQFPMYAEMSVPAFEGASRADLQRALKARLRGIEKESQRRRVEKVLKRISTGVR